MNFNLTALIVDSADLESESAFWHHLLDGSLTKTPAHHFLHVDGLPFIVIQDAPRARTPAVARRECAADALRPRHRRSSHCGPTCTRRGRPASASHRRYSRHRHTRLAGIRQPGRAPLLHPAGLTAGFAA